MNIIITEHQRKQIKWALFLVYRLATEIDKDGTHYDPEYTNKYCKIVVNLEPKWPEDEAENLKKLQRIPPSFPYRVDATTILAIYQILRDERKYMEKHVMHRGEPDEPFQIEFDKHHWELLDQGILSIMLSVTQHKESDFEAMRDKAVKQLKAFIDYWSARAEDVDDESEWLDA